MNYAYFGHHKCASTWVDNVIRNVSEEHGLVYRPVVDHETPTGRGTLRDYVNMFSREELGQYVRENGIDIVGAFTADWSQVEALRPLRGVHVIRDPRDIIVSGYFSHRNTHPVDHLPHMAAHRERLKGVAKDEGLFLEMEYAASEMEDLRTWNYSDPDILELKMEELTARPYEGFLEIFRFWNLLEDGPTSDLKSMIHRSITRVRRSIRLPRAAHRRLRWKLPIRPERVLAETYHQRFEKKAEGRVKGTVDTASHYRKGKAGDWMNHFTPAHIARFKEQFGDIVTYLGYESSNDWDARVAAGPIVSARTESRV